MRIFFGSGIAFGIGLAVFMSFLTNSAVGIAFGLLSGTVFAFGMPIILLLVGRMNEA